MTDRKSDDFIRVTVGAIMLDPFTNAPIVILKDEAEKHTVPIWIGVVEASAIAVQLEKVVLSRPLTHDLLKNIIGVLGGTVDRIDVVDLKESTYYAAIHISAGDKHFEIDSRPSDAIALALRTDSPIFLHKQVIEKSAKIDARKIPNFSEEDKEKWAELLENMNPDDFSKYKM